MTEAFPGNDPVDLEALFEAGPYCQDDDGRTSVLLRAIRDLIGPPRDHTVLVAPDDAALADKVRAAIVREHAAGQRYVNDETGNPSLGQECCARWAELHAIQKEIPDPPRSGLHVLLHAEIAYHGADKGPHGKLDVDDTDCFEGTAARLIEACLAYFGARKHVVVRDL